MSVYRTIGPLVSKYHLDEERVALCQGSGSMRMLVSKHGAKENNCNNPIKRYK